MPAALTTVAAKSVAGHDSRVAHAVDALPTIPTNLSNAERAGSAVAGTAVMALGFDGKGPGLASMLSGAYLMYRAATGHCVAYQAIGVSTAPAMPKPKSLAAKQATAGNQVTHAVTINKSAAELYQFWRHYPNLAKFMTHIIKVEGTGSKTHWVAQGPLGLKVEWDAETTKDVVNREIAWRSVEGGDVDSVGSVEFTEQPGGRGTIVKVTLSYSPPGGRVGAMLAKVFGESPEQQIRADLRQLKQLMETGEIPTVAGQPSGRK